MPPSLDATLEASLEAVFLSLSVLTGVSGLIEVISLIARSAMDSVLVMADCRVRYMLVALAIITVALQTGRVEWR